MAILTFIMPTLATSRLSFCCQVVLYDQNCIDVSSAVAAFRTFARHEDYKSFMRHGKKTAGVFANYGFYLACGMSRYLQLKMPGKQIKITVDVNAPEAQIIQELNAFDPAMLSGYPSNLALLADYDELTIHPDVVITGGELLTDTVRKKLEDTNKLLSQTVTPEEIDELTDAIAGASKVHFYIPFRTSFIYSFQQNLWIDGKNSEYQCLLPQMLSATRYLDDRAITMISTIEYSETQDMTRVFETVKEKGSTIWLTGNMESRYANYADRQLLVSKAPAAVSLIAFELFILALSERYRSKFIDR